MDSRTLYIKNMVCNRCIMAVRQSLSTAGIVPATVELGRVVIGVELTPDIIHRARQVLEPLGFELISDQRSRLVQQVKSAVLQLIYGEESERRENLSDYIARTVGRDYNYLSSLFSEATSTTIEQYHIAQRVERAKELIVYDELSLSQIADLLGYSSSAHLSSQFKKITGLAPSHFKALGLSRRRPIDEI